MKWRSAILLAVGIPVLTACGSGGDGPTAPSDLDPSLVQADSASLLNEARSAQQLEALAPDSRLSEIARAHSEAMLEQGSVPRSGPASGSLRDRLRAAGVSFRSAGQNLVQVRSSRDPAGEAHSQLFASQGHRDNILDTRFQLVGVGVAKDGRTYWITQIFVEP